MSKRILIVEDNRVAASIYAATLAHAGFQVEIATTGEDGLVAVERNVPHLILLDMMLPKMNGIELLQRVRAIHPELPVVVTSNAYTLDRMDALRNAGVTIVLNKANSKPKDVLRVVMEALAAASAQPPSS